MHRSEQTAKDDQPQLVLLEGLAQERKRGEQRGSLRAKPSGGGVVLQFWDGKLDGYEQLPQGDAKPPSQPGHR